jgi:hypothetical protein
MDILEKIRQELADIRKDIYAIKEQIHFQPPSSRQESSPEEDFTDD